ncbi:MAG: mechanosensitive ion channel family protein, partial [Alkalispirochaeta sp.]
GLRDQSRELIRKTILYIGTALLFVMVLNGAGVSVGALLGAAGVVGIAIGIASQASLSNIISGLFLVSERFFEIGDVVRIADHVGTVQSIDLLSIKVKTFDNVLIRIPNQQLIEKDIVNITRYPIRRMDFTVTVAPMEDVERTLDALRFAPEGVAQVLEEPEPFVMAGDFSEGGLTLKLGVWFERPNYVAVRNAIVYRLQQVFRERSIEIRSRTVTIDGASIPVQRQRGDSLRI